jgi:hypothetical protein
MGNPTVNLLVLDIEGAETLVLRTIPWDLVDIEVISIGVGQLVKHNFVEPSMATSH